eukprot:TRINITY_DN103824_c0_g1_i1.p1 TRINITY_DN103824_c0_g1~~TRINITY_DN103824_c0_g1_i1.p1  ORF type:complete len:303 (+),score=52.82 TRINITY_DN103824_c0_g1_i1:40-948(+)
MAGYAESAAFTYVLIPADESVPFRELTGSAEPLGDTLTELLKKDFAGGSLTDVDALRAEYGDVVDNKMSDLQAVANRGAVEVLPLVRPSKTTLPRPNTGTYLYMDEMGALKSRPPNRRASELARQCGIDLEHPLPGDVFIGRVTADEGPRSVSFAMHELDSASPWIQQAPSENAVYSGALKDFQEVVKEKQVGAKTADEQEAENIQRGWRWTQSDEDIEVTVVLPEGTQRRSLEVKTGSTSLRVAVKSESAKPLLDVVLFSRVRADDVTWTLGSDERGPYVQITAEKMESGHWPRFERAGKA